MQNDFSWVIDEQLAGMSRPGLWTDVSEDIAFLRSKGIELLVSLTLDVPGEGQLAEHGIESLHLPIHDFQPPTMQQMLDFVGRTATVIERGGGVGVHCTAGIGRTGTMLAAFLVYQGSTAAEAIQQIREIRPGSIETVEQAEAVHAYYEYLRDR